MKTLVTTMCVVNALLILLAGASLVISFNQEGGSAIGPIQFSFIILIPVLNLLVAIDARKSRKKLAELPGPT